jgi:hypothetical protein
LHKRTNNDHLYVDILEFYKLPRGVMVMSYFKSRTMGSTGGAGIADSFGSPEFKAIYERG